MNALLSQPGYCGPLGSNGTPETLSMLLNDKRLPAVYDRPQPREGSVSFFNRKATLSAIDALQVDAGENWNGRGAKAVTDETVKQAKRFIGTLSYKVPVPSVSATSNGSICFAWDGPDGSVFLATISSNCRLVYGMDAGSNRKKSGGVNFDGSAIPDIEDNLLTFIYPTLR